jgi:NitT/TauT family transport system substrate-binding protein
MIRRAIACLLFLTASSTAHAESVTVGTTRHVANGALFLAEAQGYFKAEGLEVDMTAYASDRDVVTALAGGATDLGLAGFTPAAFNFAGRGLIKAVAAQIRERKDVDGNVLVASNAGHANGMRAFENLANRPVALDQLGSSFHYQLAQIAQAKKFEFRSMTLKPMQTAEAAARAIANNQADAALLPLPYARELITSNLGGFIGWYSEIDEQQLGALFVSAKMLSTKRETIVKFIRAYRKGVTDYNKMTKLNQGKRQSTPQTREVATIIGRYAYPGMPADRATPTVENAAYYIDPQAKLDPVDLTRQIEWFKAQGLIDASVDPKAVVDTSFSN